MTATAKKQERIDSAAGRGMASPLRLLAADAVRRANSGRPGMNRHPAEAPSDR